MAAPAITVQPANQVASAPNPATFSLTATTDEGDLTYQWKSSVDNSTFTNITGATAASYTTPATLPGDNPTLYHCVVTNDGGSTTSAAVQVQVTRLGSLGKITNQDIDSSETVALIDVNGHSRLWIEFAVTVANLSAFTVEYQLFGTSSWMPMASVGTDYSNAVFPVVKASGDLAAAAASASHWVQLNTEGIGYVRIKAAGTSSKISGAYRLS